MDAGGTSGGVAARWGPGEGRRGPDPPGPRARDPPLPHPRVGEQTVEDLAAEVWPLGPDADLQPGDREPLALHLDRLLVRIARGHGALNLTIGALLRRLERLGRTIPVGYANAVDYAREQLGLPGHETMRLLRLAKACERLPLLHAALWSGRLSPVAAREILPVVAQDEARWVERACRLTVRALREQVKAALAADGHEVLDDLDREEPPATLRVRGTRAQLETFFEAIALARRKEGPRTSIAECVRMMAMEVASSLALDEPAADDDPTPRRAGGIDPLIAWPRPDWVDPAAARRHAQLRADLERLTQRWSFLDHDVPTVAGVPVSEATDPEAIDAELRRLVTARRDWDLMAGRLAYLIRRHRLWEELKFASFEHYAQERVRVAPSVLHERAQLEYALYLRPELGEALRSGRLSYSKVVLLARTKERIPLDWAALNPVQALRDRIETHERERMKNRQVLEVKLPKDVVELVDAAVRALQWASYEAGTGWLRAAEAWWKMPEHAVATWKGEVTPLYGQDRRLYARKRGLCGCPGCSEPAAARHHVHFRGQGGGEADDNKVLLCKAHHDGVHAGTFNVISLGGLTFEWHMGCRWGEPPRRILVTRDGEVVRTEEPRAAAAAGRGAG